MNSMTIPDEAVEAALWAWIESAAEGVIRENVNPRVLDRNRPRAAAALSAAMSHLHPTISNTVEVLEALPVGSVIQTVDTPLADTSVYTLWSYGWVGAGSYAVLTTSELVACAEAEPSIPGWRVLWPLGGVV